MYSIAQKTAMARRVGLLEAFTLEAFSKIEYIISGAFICLRRNRFEMHSYNSLKAMTIVKCCTLIAIQMNSDLFVVFIFFVYGMQLWCWRRRCLADFWAIIL